MKVTFDFMVASGSVLYALQDYLDQRANRTKEKRYTFDLAFDTKVSKTGKTGPVGSDS